MFLGLTFFGTNLVTNTFSERAKNCQKTAFGVFQNFIFKENMSCQTLTLQEIE